MVHNRCIDMLRPRRVPSAKPVEELESSESTPEEAPEDHVSGVAQGVVNTAARPPPSVRKLVVCPWYMRAPSNWATPR